MSPTRREFRVRHLHIWQAMAALYNDGAMDGFLTFQPEGDLFPISYYERDDLPILSTLAEEYTLYDHYFSSMLGPTWPNRLYQLCATTDIDDTGVYPEPGQPKPVNLELAIFDRMREAGLSSGYYYFGEPMTLRDRTARNLAETLDFTDRRDPAVLPEFTAPAAHVCDNPNHVG